MNNTALVSFLKSDPRFTWRTVGAIKRHFVGASTDDVLSALQAAPGAFAVRVGKMGLLIAAA